VEIMLSLLLPLSRWPWAYALAVALFLLPVGFRGAWFLFVCAAQQGFVGVAVYVACWIFLFPLMSTVSILLGGFMLWLERAEKRARSAPEHVSDAMAAMWRNEDARYEEHKRRLVEAARARGDC
jgi:hypothetical protein